MKIKIILALLCLFIQIHTTFGQEFFEEYEIVEKPTSFYQTNKHFSAHYVVSYPLSYTGVNIFIHQNKYLFSNYFEFSYAPNNDYVFLKREEGLNYIREYISGSRHTVFTGVALSIKSNILLFSKVGMEYISNGQNNNEESVQYNQTNNLNAAYGAGLMYESPQKISFCAGYTFNTNTIDLGVGFSF